MKFERKVSNAMTIKLPAAVVQDMGLEAGDLVEVSIEHTTVTSIAKSDKFTKFCKTVLKQEKLSWLYEEYQQNGGLKKQGSYRTWLVKRLELQRHGLKYWTGNDPLTDILANLEIK